MLPREWVRPWKGDGRKPKLTEEQVRELRKWAEFGTSKAAVARRLGVSHKTIRNYISGNHVRKFA